MKKCLSVCLALILLLACIPMQASADGTPTFAVGSAEANPGDTIEIPVLIENNPGIIALDVSVSFDTNVLTLQNAESASLFSEGLFTFSGSYNTNTFKILWENGAGSSNSTESGTLATLTFLVSEDAPAGETALTVSCTPTSVFNKDLVDVAFATRSGAVTILPTETGGWSFSEDSTLYTLEGTSGVQYVAGLDVVYPFITDYVETTGGWTFEVEPNDFGMESTGAKLVIYDENGVAVEEYYSVLFGDINGDGIFDPSDLALLTYAMGYVLDDPWADFVVTDEFPQSFAADANHDLILDGSDITCIVYAIGNTEDIDQVVSFD